ncbi:MAG: MFS transporter [Gammaproteobacteria bacterium]|nr:MFS transporter [Gammaproteobacteria bacterium]
MSQGQAPYWRLSGFYLFYFIGLGALVPYWGLYLQSLGFSAHEIGELLAVLMATKLVAPYLWGWIADATGRRMAVIRWGSLLAMLAFIGVFYAQTYAWMMLVMFAFSFFWNATLPQFEANTLAHLGKNTHDYSHIRLWGSIGFVLAVVVLGAVLESYGVASLPPIMLGMLASIWLVSLVTPQAPGLQTEDHSQSLLAVLRRREVIGLLLVCLLLQASHGPYYAFYSIYLEQHGYSRSTIGLYWALGVVAEIVIFMVMTRLLARFSARGLLTAALLLSAVRWLMIGQFVESHSVMFFAQLLHAASFGVYHAVSIHLFHQFFPGKLQGRGLALYTSVSFGAGGAIGALYSGYLWDSAGPLTTYALAAAMCLIAALLALKFLPNR